MSVLDLLGLNRIFKGGTEVKPTRKILNFIGDGITITDNPGQKRTDITIEGSGGGGGEGTITGPGTATPGHVTVWGADETEIADGGVALADLASEAWVTDAIEDAELAAESGIVVAVYSGHGNKSISNVATTWTDIHVAALNGWIDDLTINTSRSGSEVTVTRAGVYLVNFSMSWFGSGTFVNLRVRVNGTTKLGNSTYGGTIGSVNPSVFINGPISLQAGDVVRFQYCNSAAGSAGYAQTTDVNGESNLWIAAVHLTRVAGNTLSDEPEGISISEDGRITGVSAPSADSDADTKGARNTAILAASSGWSTALDANLMDSPAQTFVDGSQTWLGIPVTGKNIASGSAVAAVQVGTGLVIQVNSTNTDISLTGDSGPQLRIPFSSLIPDFVMGSTRVRLSVQWRTLNADSDYEIGVIGIRKAFVSANNEHLFRVLRGYHSSQGGSAYHRAAVLLGSTETGMSGNIAANNVDVIETDGYNATFYTRASPATSGDPNSVAFDADQSAVVARYTAAGTMLNTFYATLGSDLGLLLGILSGTTGRNASVIIERIRVEYSHTQLAGGVTMQSGRITGLSDPVNPQDGDTKAARDAAIKLAGWKTYCDFNFTQMANQTIVQGANTIAGIPMRADFVSNATTFAIVAGTGLYIKNTTTNSNFYYSNRNAPMIYVDLPVDIPGWIPDISEVRISCEWSTTVATANYTASGFGVAKQPFVMNADLSVHFWHQYSAGMRRAQARLYGATETSPAVSSTYNTAAIHYRTQYDHHMFAKNNAAADSTPNAQVLDLATMVRTGAVREAPSGGAAFNTTPYISNLDHLIAFWTGHSDNTLGNAEHVCKRLRIEYRL